MTSPRFRTPPSRSGALPPLRESVYAAAKYWERRRIGYNAALALLALAWIVLTWPHFVPALTLDSAGKVLILAFLANVCYCAAYAVDIPLSRSDVRSTWQRWRFLLWLAGTLCAVLFACYWIADEIYPFVS